jgi:hypothetical protein
MSSPRRAGAGAESILASLERGKAGVSGARGIPRTQLAWLAGAASVILLLIVVLAWLAYSNATKVRMLPGAEARRPPPAELMLARNDAPAAPPAAALILDVPAAAPAPSRQAMVLLAPASSTPLKAAPPPAALAEPVRTVTPKPSVAAARAPAKKSRPAPLAKPEPEAVDTDVALLAAIVAHASSHAAERAQLEAAACAGKNCPTKSAPRP